MNIKYKGTYSLKTFYELPKTRQKEFVGQEDSLFINLKSHALSLSDFVVSEEEYKNKDGKRIDIQGIFEMSYFSAYGVWIDPWYEEVKLYYLHW